MQRCLKYSEHFERFEIVELDVEELELELEFEFEFAFDLVH